MHDARLIHDVRNHKGAIRRTADVSESHSFLKHMTHSYHVNKPLNIRGRYSVIIMGEKLLITLYKVSHNWS